MDLWAFSVTPGNAGGLSTLTDGAGIVNSIASGAPASILASVLPEGSPITGFMNNYSTAKQALDAAAAMGLTLPASLAAPLAQAGIGLYGSAGSWAGAGAAQAAGGSAAAGAGGALGGLASGLAGAGLFLGAMSFISALPDLLQGGASDKAKPGKFFGAIKADPSKAPDMINRMITNQFWTNEAGTNWKYIMGPLMENGALDETYPTFWSKDSQWDLTKGIPQGTRKNPGYSKDDWQDDNNQKYLPDKPPETLPLNRKIMFGWDVENDEEYKRLRSEAFTGDDGVTKTRRFGYEVENTWFNDKNAPLWMLLLKDKGEEAIYNDDVSEYAAQQAADDWGRRSDNPFPSRNIPPKAPPGEALANAIPWMHKNNPAMLDYINYVKSKTSPEAKQAHFTDVYNQIKSTGYIGDLSKLENYLGV